MTTGNGSTVPLQLTPDEIAIIAALRIAAPDKRDAVQALINDDRAGFLGGAK